MSNETILEAHLNNSIIPVSLESTNNIIKQMKYSVCKIHKIGKEGTGFFCKLPYKSKQIPFLITNNHVLGNEDIEKNKEIKILLNKEFKNIKIDKNRIAITNKEIDYTLIEIKENIDQINIDHCLEVDENINNEENNLPYIYVKKSIYTIHYPKDENVSVSYGLLSQINEKEINHLCSTDDGSSGAPILSLKNLKVIGVHYGYKKINEREINKAIFIKYIISELNKYEKNSEIYESKIINNNNFVNINNNYQINQNINFNDNLLNNNINNNMFNKNYNNQIIMENNINEEFPIKIIKKSEGSLSVHAFPSENNFINIIFQNEYFGFTNIIIPSYKKVLELFNIYAKVIQVPLNKIDFMFNINKMNINDERQISQVFNNISKIYIIIKKN